MKRYAISETMGIQTPLSAWPFNGQANLQSPVNGADKKSVIPWPT